MDSIRALQGHFKLGWIKGALVTQQRGKSAIEVGDVKDKATLSNSMFTGPVDETLPIAWAVNNDLLPLGKVLIRVSEYRGLFQLGPHPAQILTDKREPGFITTLEHA